MKRMFSVFLLITVWLLVTPFLQAQSHVDKVLKDEITSDLKENILSFWERYSVDSSGGSQRWCTECPHPLDFFNRLPDVWRYCLP